MSFWKRACQRCKMKVEKAEPCEICHRFVCNGCKDEYSGICVDCTTELSQNPEEFLKYIAQIEFEQALLYEEQFENKGEENEYDYGFEEYDYDYDLKDNPFQNEEEYAGQEEEYEDDERIWAEKCGRDKLVESWARNEEYVQKREENKAVKEEILKLSKRYDEDYPTSWWARKEKEIGERIRESKEVTFGDLVEINDWKNKLNENRRRRNLLHVKLNKDVDIRRISRSVFLDSKTDRERIEGLYMNGVKNGLASAILTFYNPNEYCVFDRLVCEELFGESPKDWSPKDWYEFYTNPEYYMKLLTRLRDEAKKYSLDVRTLEKAFFKKRLDNLTSKRQILRASFKVRNDQ